MDALMCFKLLTVIVFIFPVSAALRVLVTKEQCGRSIDLTVEQELYLDYEGAELGNTLSHCVINVTNYNARDVICIKSEGTSFLNTDCAMLLTYNIGDMKSWPDNGTSYTCSDFYLRPLCDRCSVSSVVYRYTFRKTGSVKVKLFTKKYVATTTIRDKPTWYSWSSDYDDNDDVDYDDDDEGSTNTPAIVIGVIPLIILVCFICCLCLKAHGSSTPTPENGSPAVLENQASAPEVEPSAPVIHYHQGDLDESHTLNSADGFVSQRQSDNSGYHTHNSINQQVPNQENQTGFQSDQPPPSYDSLPSAPPPPYPGY